MPKPVQKIKHVDVRVPVTIRLPVNYRNMLAMLAIKEDTSLNDLIVGALREKYPS